MCNKQEMLCFYYIDKVDKIAYFQETHTCSVKNLQKDVPMPTGGSNHTHAHGGLEATPMPLVPSHQGQSGH